MSSVKNGWIEASLVQQMVREELQAFAKQHLAQISSSVEQTSRLLQEQLSRSGGHLPYHGNGNTSMHGFADIAHAKTLFHNHVDWPVPQEKSQLSNGGPLGSILAEHVSLGEKSPFSPNLTTRYIDKPIGDQASFPIAPFGDQDGQPITSLDDAPEFPPTSRRRTSFFDSDQEGPPMALRRTKTSPSGKTMIEDTGSPGFKESDGGTPQSTWSSRKGRRRVSLPPSAFPRRLSQIRPDPIDIPENQEEEKKEPQSKEEEQKEQREEEKKGERKRAPRTPKLIKRLSLLQPLFTEVKESQKYSNRKGSIINWSFSSGDVVGEACFIHLVQSPLFVYLIGIAILANAVTIGVQTNYMATHATTQIPPRFYAMEAAFCFIFTFEILLRLCAYGCEFFTMDEWKWNMFDMIIVLMQIVENAMSLTVFMSGGAAGIKTQDTDGLTVLYTLRLFRLLRILRMVRMIHIIGEFQAIVVAISVTDDLISGHYEDQDELKAFFGSLSTSMMSLFQSISDGVEWRDAWEPLSPSLRILFTMYIAFSSFALMNMLTGIFVDKALQSGQAERRRFLLEQVGSIFTGANDVVQVAGKVTWADFQAHLGDPEMQSLLNAIDVDAHDAHELFHILDTHNDGAIEVGEFVNGCLSLDGPAKAIDLAAFVQESRTLNQKWIAQAQFVNKALVQIQKMVAHLDQINTFVRGVSGASDDSERMISP